MPAEYVYSCTLRSAVIHIGAGYVVILIKRVFQNLQVGNDSWRLRFLFAKKKDIRCFFKTKIFAIFCKNSENAF